MPHLPNDERETGSDDEVPRSQDQSDEVSDGCRQSRSPAFEDWLNNYRNQLDKVFLRGDRVNEIREHETLLPSEGRSK
jgi:hypothetical protein